MPRVRHEYVTEEDFDERYRRDGRRLAPGFWVDRHGQLHISIPELLAVAKLPESPEDRAAVLQIVNEFIERIPEISDVVYCDPIPPSRRKGHR